MRLARLAGALAAGAAALALGAAPAPARAQAVDCVAVDGDEMQCGRERVRLAGIVAPRLDGRCERERRMAFEARERLARIIENGATMHPVGRDRRGRLVAEMRDRRGRDVAEVMVRRGLALPAEERGPDAFC